MTYHPTAAGILQISWSMLAGASGCMKIMHLGMLSLKATNHRLFQMEAFEIAQRARRLVKTRAGEMAGFNT